LLFMTILSFDFSFFFIRFFIRHKNLPRKTTCLFSLERKKGGFAFLSLILSLFSRRFFTYASKSVNQVSEDDEYLPTRPRVTFCGTVNYTFDRFALSSIFLTRGFDFSRPELCSVCIISRRDEVEFYDGLIP